MIYLTELAFLNAKTFLLAGARPLEARLFEFHFPKSDEAQSAVIKELEAFQNPDGGFGKGLEPDLRLESSSVVATKYALQILIDIQADTNEKIVIEGIKYLLNKFDHEKQVWALVSEDVMNAPHAPWWEFSNLEKEFGSFLVNPKAGILRCLYDYRELVPDDILKTASASLMSDFEELPVEMQFFDAISLLQLLGAEGLSEEYRERLATKLSQTGKKIVNPDPNDWEKFAVKPLWLAPSPHSPLANILGAEVQNNLDYEIKNQSADGSWSPTWSWGEVDPENWEIVRNEWKGILTLATLRSLRDYGRIENYIHEDNVKNYKYQID